VKKCDFCNWRDVANLRDRVFYDDPEWFAFLDAPFHTHGHAVLTMQPDGIHCPRDIRQVPASLSTVISKIVKGFDEFYAPRDILIASLRGHIPHIHFHLIPLWSCEEQEWRLESGHKRGGLMTFLGYLEARRDERFRRERIRRGWSQKKEREEIAKSLHHDVEKLNRIIPSQATAALWRAHPDSS